MFGIAQRADRKQGCSRHNEEVAQPSLVAKDDVRKETSGDILAKTPMQSIASALQGWAEVIAAYRFFNNPKTSVQNVLSSHR